MLPTTRETTPAGGAIVAGGRLLAARSRQVLTWRFYDGLTQAECAARLGCHQMHISRIQRAALAVLRRALVE